MISKVKVESKAGDRVWLCVIFAAVILFAAGIVIMRQAAGELSAYADGATILDLRFGYSPEEAKQFLQAIGAKGISLYYHDFYSIDFFYPITYTLFYSSVIAFLLRKLAPGNWALKLLLILPVFGMLMDWLENFCLHSIVERFGVASRALYTLSSSVTILKFICVYSSALLIIVLIGLLVFRKVFRK